MLDFQDNNTPLRKRFERSDKSLPFNGTSTNTTGLKCHLNPSSFEITFFQTFRHITNILQRFFWCSIKAIHERKEKHVVSMALD